MQYYSSGRLSQHLLWLACLAGVVGLLAARALVALSPVVGVLAALANPALRQAWPHYFRNGGARWAAAMFGFLLLSGLYTSHWAEWRHELFRYLVWLGVPLAFTVAVPLTAQQRWWVGVAFVVGTSAVGLATLGQYLADPLAATTSIVYGQNITPFTGVFHIAFGVMLALTFYGGLLLRRSSLTGPGWRWGLLGAAGLAALTLHVLAYRTGLLVWYVALLATGLRLLWRRQRRLGLLALALLGLAPWLAYRTLPSVRDQVGASLWDVYQFQEGRDINRHSLGQRLAAAETALLVIRQHWLVGVAPADATAAMLDQYGWRSFGLAEANRVEVHNQYLQALLGGGVLGLALLLALLGWPLLRHGPLHPGVGYFILIQATAMLVDSPMALQTGLNLFVFGYGFLVVAEERMRRSS